MSGRLRKKQFSEKPLIKGFKILGVLGLPARYTSVKNLQFWGVLSTFRVLPIILTLPLLPLPFTRGLKDHFSSNSCSLWKLK